MATRTETPPIVARRANTSNVRRFLGGAVVAAAVIVLYSTVAGYDGAPAPRGVENDAPAVAVLPAALGTQARAWSMTGREALDQVEGLHLSRLPLSSAEVAGYGPSTTVWVARPDGASAREYVTKMTDAIAAGGSPFAVPERATDGVWRTTGAGQDHFYFAAGGDVWWLATDAASADATLSALLTEARA
jgi:hypothetical protein